YILTFVFIITPRKVKIIASTRRSNGLPQRRADSLLISIVKRKSAPVKTPLFLNAKNFKKFLFFGRASPTFVTSFAIFALRRGR
ncbi:MAG: hypothetical protein IJY15_07000, partial [Thermoguttaceae bacterium]|nr:hypothetical protein [Thermoguttaceae bacterium]